MEQKIGERQRWAWLAAGFSVIAAANTCGYGWLWVLLGSLAVVLLHLYLNRRLPHEGVAEVLAQKLGYVGKIVNGLAFLWIVLMMGWAACLADTAFPMVDGFPILGWVMLALAAWGSRKGAAACAGCCGVLYLFLIVLYGIVVVFAIPDIKTEYLKPVGSWEEAVWTVGVCLLPASVWYVPGQRAQKGLTWGMALLLPIFAAVLAAVTAGVLSPVLARGRAVPLFDLAQSVSLFGVVERIEPLLSAAMVMGVFALLSVLACACQSIGSTIRKWNWHGTAACILAGAVMYGTKNLQLILLTIGAVAVFACFPVIAVIVDAHRKKK